MLPLWEHYRRGRCFLFAYTRWQDGPYLILEKLLQNILIIEPSTSGLELLPTAHVMGLAVFVLTANQDERIIPKRYRQYIFKQIVVDTDDF